MPVTPMWSCSTGRPRPRRPWAEPTSLDDITCVVSTDDIDGDAVIADIRWLVDGEEVATGEVLDHALTAPGDAVACEATPDDGEQRGIGARSFEAEVANLPPTVLSVTLSPDPSCVDDTLPVDVQNNDPDDDAADLAFAWTVDGEPAGGGATLDGSSALDKGKVVACAVTPDDGEASGDAGYDDAGSVEAPGRPQRRWRPRHRSRRHRRGRRLLLRRRWPVLLPP